MSTVIGLDFGTTNSALAVGDRQGNITLARFKDGESETTTFKSILYFPSKAKDSARKLPVVAGPHAIRDYLEADTKGRLIQSVKSYLASRLFTHTYIDGRGYTLEELIAIILRQLKEAAEAQFGDLRGGAVVLRHRVSRG